MNQSAKRILSFVLCLAMLVGLFPAFALGADAAGTTHYLVFATDRHGNSSVIAEVLANMESNGAQSIEYVGLGGDMPANDGSYQTSTLLQEVNDGLATDLTAEQVDVTKGSHDDNVTDDSNMFHSASGELYIGDGYAVYGIVQADMESASSAQTAAAAFQTWAAGIDASDVIIVLSHLPLHKYRNDNLGATYWDDALNTLAVGDDTTIDRDIIFFHGHNHSQDNGTNYHYGIGEGFDLQGTSSSSSESTTNYYTYATAGYLNDNSQASLVTITDTTVSIDRYKTSGTGTAVDSVTRVASADSGDGDSGNSGTTTEEKEVYVLTDTMTVGKDYLIANGNTGTVTLLGQSSGSATTTTADVVTSGSYTYIETADSGYVWNATAHTNSSYSSYPRLINAETYAMYVSNGSLAFGSGLTDTSGAIYTRYWTYSDGQLACVSTNSGSDTYYLTYSSSAFSATSTATDGIYIYEKQTITVSSDGTVSGGDSSDGDSSGSTDNSGEESTGASKDETVGSDDVTVEAYVLTTSLTAGEEYLIVNTNAAGDGYALLNNSGSVSSVDVEILESDSGNYIILSESGAVWTAVTNSSGVNLTNTLNGTTYYIEATGSSSAISIDNSDDNSDRYWTYSGSQLYYGSSSGNKHYVYYSDGFVSEKSSSETVYIYQKQTITTSASVTYSMSAKNLTQVVDKSVESTLTGSLNYELLADGETATLPDGGSYGFTVTEGDAENAIISSIDPDGTVHFTGEIGTATVRVSYTWTDADGVAREVYKELTVTTEEPTYSVDITTAVYDDDGNKSAGSSITDTIAIKGDTAIKAGYDLWAQVSNGIENITVEQSALVWTSSDTTIATVDADGNVTFTGKEGTVKITVVYEYTDGESVTDTVAFSVTKTSYIIPSDGTNDFPEYPKEGAIRYDKNAVAVGNFSQTGIAQLELSMTGVPYTTGSEFDVLLVVDASGSMDESRIEAAQNATYDFVTSIVQNKDDTFNENRVGIMYFGSKEGYPTSVTGVDTTDYGFAMSTVSSVNSDSDVYKAIYDNFPTSSSSSSGSNGPGQSGSTSTTVTGGFSGGTNYDNAFSVAYEIVNSVKQTDRPVYVVFITDGGPTQYTPLASAVQADDGTYTLTADTTLYMTGESKTVWSNYVTNGADYQDNYYAAQIKYLLGATMYTVSIELDADPDGQYSGYNTTSMMALGEGLLSMIASSTDKYYAKYADSSNGTTDLTQILAGIAKEIKQAATDVVVQDQITNDYTMIFDVPTGSVGISDAVPEGQEFYIEVIDYELTPVYGDANDTTLITDYVRSTGTSKIKLYLGVNGTTYYAATAANSTNGDNAFDTPTFDTTKVGNMLYWTTDSTKGDQGVSVVGADDTTYYFVSTGDGTHNMTAGAYASGNISADTNTSSDLIIATPYFVYNASTRMLVWTAEKLSESELAITYFLYLDDSATEVGFEDEVDPKTYPTNVEATITYTNFQDNRCQQEFPIPQMTWKGAQVSYVFYLVNEDGQPVNRAGRVIPFSEAVYVTDVYTYSVVWNDELETEQLSAAQLASGLVPDVYSLYDTAAYYEINVYESNDTYQDYFIIEGSDTVTSTETTKVFNTKSDADHRYSTYGAYSSVGGTYTSSNSKQDYTATVTTGFDYSNTTVAFAVVWSPELVPDVVVIDYGLDVLIDVTTNDALASGVVGVMTTKPDAIINEGSYDTAVGTTSTDVYVNGLKIGTASRENQTTVRFSLDKDNGMQMTDPAVFYYESAVNYYDEDSKLITTNMYSSVTVIPATTIYYEDEYVDLSSFTWDYDTNAWSEVTADSDVWTWSQAGTTISDTQDVDRPGASSLVMPDAYDADNLYGYDSAYTTCSEYSMGSALLARVDYDNYATASFTFYGTGFDIVALTSDQTGTVFAHVYAVNADGTVATTTTKNTTVDTYYGYDFVDTDSDGVADTWQVITDSNGENALYQVPVIKVEDLPYGQYKVVLGVQYSTSFDHGQYADTDGDGYSYYDFYLDAIRIYDPAGTEYGTDDTADSVTGNLIDSTIQNAYTADKEGWPLYEELRNNVIAAAEATGEINGVVFIDGIHDTAVVSDYTSYGPNNELYLAGGQAIIFTVDLDSFVNSAGESIVASVQLGMKSADGEDVTCYVFDAAAVEDQGDLTGLAATTIATSTGMYFDITSLKDATIVIFNDSNSVLSLTDLKVTFTEAPTASALVGTVSAEDLNTFVEALNTEETTEESSEATEESTEETTEGSDSSSSDSSVISKIISALKKLFGWG